MLSSLVWDPLFVKSLESKQYLPDCVIASNEVGIPLKQMYKS